MRSAVPDGTQPGTDVPTAFRAVVDLLRRRGRHVDAAYYDWPYPARGEPAGPPTDAPGIEEPPFIVPSGWRAPRCRCDPSLPPGTARMMRVNHDYHRRGAVAYLAAYDVHRARVFGRCQDTTGITPFEALVEQVMTQEPYKSASRVFWVVDNGSSHRGQKAVDRLKAQFPNAVMVHTPVHASWLNQVSSSPSSNGKCSRPTTSSTPTRSPSVWTTSKTLQPARHTVQMEVHDYRPPRLPATPGPAHRPPGRRVTTDELTNLTT